ALHHVLELDQVFGYLLLGVLTEEGGDEGAEPSAWRSVFQRDSYFSHMFGEVKEPHRARVGDGRAFERTPGDQLVLLIVRDLGVPFDLGPRRRFGHPMRTRRT